MTYKYSVKFLEQKNDARRTVLLQNDEAKKTLGYPKLVFLWVTLIFVFTVGDVL